METLVLPAQDQLSQHHYWQKQRVFSSPCSRPRKHDPLLSPLPSSAPSRPLYRSAQEFASPAPLARSLSGALENASKERASQENAPKITRGSRPANPRSKIPAPRLPDSGRPRSGFGKKFEARRREESAGVTPPKITILQRPQSREAAMLDLAKITGLPLSEVYAKNGLTLPEEKPKAEPRKEAISVRVREDPRKGQMRKIPNPSNTNSRAREAEQTKKKVVRPHEGENPHHANPEQSKKVATMVHPEPRKPVKKVTKVHEETNVRVKVSNKNFNRISSVESVAEVTVAEEKSPEPATMMFSKSFEGFMFEKWAGPAFTNSPPPSSLPIPNFSSLKKNPQRLAVAAPPAELQQMIDTEAATKGLRRILNLNF